MLDNLIELTAEQLILRHSPIVRKELGNAFERRCAATAAAGFCVLIVSVATLMIH
jgi:hypothetical protein